MLEAINLHKSYRRDAVSVSVLRGVDLAVREGEFLSVIGASGSGKSTLLHLLGALDTPDTGEVRFEGRRVDTLPARDRERLRNQSVGFVFQFYHLLPELTALENVLMPAMISRGILRWLGTRGAVRKQAMDLLDRVGLSHRLHHRPRELSGGELQRASIARALIMNPKVLLADEPTGNLDEGTGAGILTLLRGLHSDGLTIVMVTHNLELTLSTDRVVRLAAGRVETPSNPSLRLLSPAC
ncbi:MAG: ABC transporter ATP-binding protein [Gemmataceae bacterium]|nr:ABC transporter ATP-binding protein [Gemmataceae bacterium]